MRLDCTRVSRQLMDRPLLTHIDRTRRRAGSICLEPLTQKKMARVEPCRWGPNAALPRRIVPWRPTLMRVSLSRHASRHWFHLACLQEYVDKMQLSRCPLCRDELTGSVTTANPSDP